MTYRNLALGCIVTLVVTGTLAATDSANKTQPPPTTPAPAQTAPAKPATTPAQTPSAKSPATVDTAPGQMPPGHGATAPVKKTAPAKPEKKVDINNATLAELKTLPTVGDAEAKKIIASRPYQSKGELVTKAGLPEGVYQAVRHKIEMQKPRKPAPKK